MPLWGNKDANTGAPLFAGALVNAAPTPENASDLWSGDNKENWIEGAEVQIVGVETEEKANGEFAGVSAGWALKTEGTGGRAGRVTYETLVAMKSITKDAVEPEPEPEPDPDEEETPTDP